MGLVGGRRGGACDSDNGPCAFSIRSASESSTSQGSGRAVAAVLPEGKGAVVRHRDTYGFGGGLAQGGRRRSG